MRCVGRPSKFGQKPFLNSRPVKAESPVFGGYHYQPLYNGQVDNGTRTTLSSGVLPWPRQQTHSLDTGIIPWIIQKVASHIRIMHFIQFFFLNIIYIYIYNDTFTSYLIIIGPEVIFLNLNYNQVHYISKGGGRINHIEKYIT